MQTILSRFLTSVLPLAAALSLASACGRPGPSDVEDSVASEPQAVALSVADTQALHALGPGWSPIAAGVAEKQQRGAVLHAAFNAAGERWMRARLTQALHEQEQAQAGEPTPEREQHLTALRQALRTADARGALTGPRQETSSLSASADFSGTEACNPESGGAVFSVYSMSRWQADFPLFGEAAAVAGADSEWDGRTVTSGVASTSATSRGACNVPIPGFRGHQVSGSDPATGKAVYFGAAYTLSCTVPCSPPPPPWCMGSGEIICYNSCGEEYCYRGSRCPAPKRPEGPYTCF